MSESFGEAMERIQRLEPISDTQLDEVKRGILAMASAPIDDHMAREDRQSEHTKIIHVTASQGHEIELCPECHCVVGDTVAFFTMLMPERYNVTDEEKKHPLTAFISFVPEHPCQCKKAGEL